jgi:hypothetical protein
MTDQATSPFRRRMIEDMMIRKFAPKTNMTMCKRSRTSPRFSACPPSLEQLHKRYRTFDPRPAPEWMSGSTTEDEQYPLRKLAAWALTSEPRRRT